MKNKLVIVSLLLFLSLSACNDKKGRIIDLSGQWTVKLDSAGTGIANNWHNMLFDDIITLPGTTDDAAMGTPNTLTPKLEKPQLTYLTRKNSYVGPTWYSREITIPSDWKEKEIMLNLERVMWLSQVWVDGNKVNSECESLISPHQYNLTSYLKPGKHLLTIRIDNEKRHDITFQDLAHAYTNHTQIMWNGMLGNLSISAKDPVYITNVQIYPDIDKKSFLAKIELQNSTSETQKGKLVLTSIQKSSNKSGKALSAEIEAVPGISVTEISYDMGDDAQLWDEFSPEVYTLKTEVTTNEYADTDYTDFGMRNISKNGSVLTINNNPLFLRGTLECCVFPLTGTPPMTKDGWKKVFSVAKEWGLNHLRFHSWCPPAAAFEVADEMGFYLQIELPLWALTVGQSERDILYLKEEANHIIKKYGNHPSFCLWSLGNELQGDFSVLSQMLDELKLKDPRHLYTTTSFTFEKGHGDWPEANDDFFITQWTKKGWVRGQGVFNQYPPSFDKDYRKAVDSMSVPLITHEIGQYSVYPNLKEISKYTGVLEPLNFLAVQADLKEKNMLDKADLYTLSSGKLAAILYKEEIERALKTKGISGFQLLDLHDFPGQGTALVGLLDAFWDNKGVISANEFHQFCSSVVPLLRFPKAVYLNNESYTADIEVSNYSNEKIVSGTLEWDIRDGKGQTIAKGDVQLPTLKLGHNSGLGSITAHLSDITEAEMLTVRTTIKGTPHTNKWNIWVYPSSQKVDYGNVKITRNLNEAIQLLNAGNTVLFNPDWKLVKGIEGKFVPVFWSPVHFPRQAGTMGILCDPTHKALAHFPTDIHTDWQWWDLNVNSTTLIIDSIQGGTPIVEMIDNFANNRKLASLIEGKVGNGKLMIATFDLVTDLENRPVAKQMLYSLMNYMNSTAFDPNPIKNPEILKDFLKSDVGNVKKESATSIY